MSGAELGYKSINGKALNYWIEKGLDEKAKRRLSFSETQDQDIALSLKRYQTAQSLQQTFECETQFYEFGAIQRCIWEEKR